MSEYYKHKASGDVVRLIWQSHELVTVQTAGGTLSTMRKFVFLQDFEEQVA